MQCRAFRTPALADCTLGIRVGPVCRRKTRGCRPADGAWRLQTACISGHGPCLVPRVFVPKGRITNLVTALEQDSHPMYHCMPAHCSAAVSDPAPPQCLVTLALRRPLSRQAVGCRTAGRSRLQARRQLQMCSGSSVSHAPVTPAMRPLMLSHTLCGTAAGTWGLRQHLQQRPSYARPAAVASPPSSAPAGLWQPSSSGCELQAVNVHWSQQRQQSCLTSVRA